VAEEVGSEGRKALLRRSAPTAIRSKTTAKIIAIFTRLFAYNSLIFLPIGNDGQTVDTFLVFVKEEP
jgi:hypothetical protein